MQYKISYRRFDRPSALLRPNFELDGGIVIMSGKMGWWGLFGLMALTYEKNLSLDIVFNIF